MKLKNFVILAVVFYPIFATCMILLILGKVTTSYTGIAVDSNQRLYVGKDYVIDVIENGKKIDEITVKKGMSGSYFFTIENDNILISKELKIYILDLNGNQVSVELDDSMHKSLEISKSSFDFRTSDNSRFQMKNVFGRYIVVKTSPSGQKTTVFKMPFKDYFAKIMFGISFVISMVSIFMIIVNKFEFPPILRPIQDAIKKRIK